MMKSLWIVFLIPLAIGCRQVDSNSLVRRGKNLRGSYFLYCVFNNSGTSLTTLSTFGLLTLRT